VVADLKIVEADSKTALMMTYNKAKEEEGPDQGAKAQTEELMEDKAEKTTKAKNTRKGRWGRWSHGS